MNIIKAKWNTSFAKISVQVPPHLWAWLTKTPRLVDALSKLYADDFRFKLLFEGESAVVTEEAARLPASPAFWLRRVGEGQGSEVLVYSRVVIPETTLKAFQQKITTLGERPIGNHLLFDNPEVTRAPFEYALISRQDDYPDALTALGVDTAYARRSLFSWRNHQLLISEFFSPHLKTLAD